MAVAVPQMASNRLIKRPQVSSHLEKPKIIFGGFVKTSQNYVEIPATASQPAQLNQSEIYRLALKNDSKKTAKAVIAELFEITDTYGHVRNLIPAPFQWTHQHLVGNFRDIAPGQSVFLDLIQSCRTFQNQYRTSFVVPALSLNNNMIMANSNCFVKVKIYGDNIEPQEIKLKVNYSSHQGNFPDVVIEENQ